MFTNAATGERPDADAEGARTASGVLVMSTKYLSFGKAVLARRRAFGQIDAVGLSFTSWG
jgi:hypothetical protein